MSKEVTQSEIDSVISSLRLSRHRQGVEAVADCPECGKKEKLYVNTTNGLFQCKHASCEISGNLFKLANLLNVRVRQDRIVKGAVSYFASSIQRSAARSRVSVINAKGITRTYVESLSESMLNGDERFKDVLEYLRKRGFDDDTISHFNLCPWKLSKTKDHPEQIGVGIPYLVSGKVPLIKQRNLESGKQRRFMRTKGSSSPLYNGCQIEQCESVILCEAELDACSIWQLGKTNVAATSLGAKKEIPQDWLFHISAAQEVVLWYDNDEAGQAALTILINQVGVDRAKIASLDDAEGLLESFPHVKDANDILQLDVPEEKKRAWVAEIVEKAKPIEQDEIVDFNTFAGGILPKDGENVLGVPIDLEPLSDLLKGWRPGEVTIVTGHSGHGKTTLGSFLVEQAGNHCPVLMTSFENGPEDLAEKMFQREMGIPVSWITEKEIDAAYDAIERCKENKDVYIANIRKKQDKDYFFNLCKWAVRRLGVKVILVDHLQYFRRDKGQDSFDHVESLAQDLHHLAVDLNVHFIAIGHVNGAVDEGKIPTGGNMKGGTAIKQECNNGITVYRHKDFSSTDTTKTVKIRDDAGKMHSLQLSKNQAVIYVWKARYSVAEEGVAVVNFNRNSLKYSDPDDQRIKEEVVQEVPQDDDDFFDEF